MYIKCNTALQFHEIILHHTYSIKKKSNKLSYGSCGLIEINIFTSLTSFYWWAWKYLQIMKIEVVLAIARIVLLFVAISLITLIIHYQTVKQDTEEKFDHPLFEVLSQNDSTSATEPSEASSQITLGITLSGSNKFLWSLQILSLQCAMIQKLEICSAKMKTMFLSVNMIREIAVFVRQTKNIVTYAHVTNPWLPLLLLVSK